MDTPVVAEQPGTTNLRSDSESPATGPASAATAFRGAARHRLRRVIQAGPIGWAAFLACSWTWCIGMFLPVLLIGDYGFWGWVLFAAPNIVGAAAMGWTLRDPEASRAMQQAHAPACRSFSLVTLVFHAYFVIALAPRLFGDELIWLTAVLLLPFLFLLHGRGRTGRRATVSSALALAVSVIAMLAVLAYGGIPTFPTPAKGKVDLLWLAPVMIFGFLLDPYLDLTFHRARQSTTRAGGRTAFGLGFGVFFLLMIVFTAIYAPPLIDALATGHPLPPRQDLFAAVVVVHLALQSAFTIAAHFDALRASNPPGRVGWIIALAAGLALAVALRVVLGRFASYHGLSTGEAVYRGFLSFYGLVFPAYVWLFAVPRRLKGVGPIPTTGPTQGQSIFFLSVLALAAPMYWLSFIEGRMIWAVPGLLLVFVSRFLLPKPAVAGAAAAAMVP